MRIRNLLGVVPFFAYVVVFLAIPTLVVVIGAFTGDGGPTLANVSALANGYIVDAFVRTTWVEGVNDPGRTVQSRPIPMISQHANRAAAVPSPLAVNSNLPVPGSPADVS